MWLLLLLQLSSAAQDIGTWPVLHPRTYASIQLSGKRTIVGEPFGRGQRYRWRFQHTHPGFKRVRICWFACGHRCWIRLATSTFLHRSRLASDSLTKFVGTFQIWNPRWIVQPRCFIGWISNLKREIDCRIKMLHWLVYIFYGATQISYWQTGQNSQERTIKFSKICSVFCRELFLYVG